MSAQPHDTAARVLADIGGTNARFAWQAGPGHPVQAVLNLPCAEHGSLSDAVHSYLHRTQRAIPAAIAIAIANPVVGDRVAMTNHHWSFSIRELKAQLGLQRLLVVNDFTALALALPRLGPADRWQLGGGAAAPEAAIGLIGPGTGLGVSGLLPDGRGGWLPIQGEGGHSTLAATTPRCWSCCAPGTAMRRPSEPSAARGWWTRTARCCSWTPQTRPRSPCRPPTSPNRPWPARTRVAPRRCSCSAPSWAPRPATWR